MKKRILFTSCLIICILSFAAAGNAGAENAQLAELAGLVRQLQTEMGEMRQLIASQNEKIDKLEKNQSQVFPTGDLEKQGAGPGTGESSDILSRKVSESLGGADKWLKGVRFAGDFRLRYDGIHYSSGDPQGADDRNRFRFRLRLGFEKTFNPDMQVGFSLASGSMSDPTSTNQTMGELFTWKAILIDKAYAKYTPRWAQAGPVEKLTFAAGKTSNPFERASTDMIWDSDVRPEGAYEQADFNFVDGADFGLKSFVTAGQFVLRESANTGGDANLFAVQAGLMPRFATPFFEKPVEGLSAVSYYDYSNYAKNGHWRLSDGTSLARGNTILNVNNSNNLDAQDFQIITIYNELKIFPWKPLSLFNEYAMNPAEATKLGMVRRGNFAWSLGAKLNRIERKGDWECIYQYKYIGPNSIVGAFADADFGDGFAGKCGSVFKLGYALTDNLSIYGNAFLVSNTNAGTEGILDQKQNRFQIDLNWKF